MKLGFVVLASIATASVGSTGCGGDDSDLSGFDSSVNAGPLDGGTTTGLPGMDAGKQLLGRTYYWADWTDFNYAPDSGARGEITLPTGPIQVAYTGDLYGAQVSDGQVSWDPSDPYVSRAVGNAPPGTDVIKLEGGNSDPLALTFSQPVLDPVLAIASLGSSEQTGTCVFDEPFEIVSQGMGVVGNGPLTQSPGNQLSGREGNGVIRFRGMYSLIRWTEPMGERFHGFTVGIANPADGWDGGGP